MPFRSAFYSCSFSEFNWSPKPEPPPFRAGDKVCLLYNIQPLSVVIKSCRGIIKWMTHAEDLGDNTGLEPRREREGGGERVQR